MNDRWENFQDRRAIFLAAGLFGLCVLAGCQKPASLSAQAVVPPAAAYPASQAPSASGDNEDKDIDLAKSLIAPQAMDVRLERNFFRPLVGPDSLKEELARAAGKTGEAAAQGIVTPESLKLVLKGVVLSGQPIAYVSSPEDDFVLRLGGRISTMQLQDIRPDEIIFLLENGESAVLSNLKEEKK